jgi:hypothetical protein
MLGLEQYGRRTVAFTIHFLKDGAVQQRISQAAMMDVMLTSLKVNGCAILAVEEIPEPMNGRPTPARAGT